MLLPFLVSVLFAGCASDDDSATASGSPSTGSETSLGEEYPCGGTPETGNAGDPVHLDLNQGLGFPLIAFCRNGACVAHPDWESQAGILELSCQGYGDGAYYVRWLR